MRLILQRATLAPTSLLGQLWIGAGFVCYTLEPRLDRPDHPAIQAGVYPLTIEPTHNPHLWSPYENRDLPHLWKVPDRSGIEMHAGNKSEDTAGCIVVAYEQFEDSVGRSRSALKRLMELILNTKPPHEIHVIDIASASLVG